MTDVEVQMGSFIFPDIVFRNIYTICSKHLVPSVYILAVCTADAICAYDETFFISKFPEIDNKKACMYYDITCIVIIKCFSRNLQQPASGISTLWLWH